MNETESQQAFDDLFFMPVREFENTIIGMFSAYGYEVKRSGHSDRFRSPHHLEVRKDNERALVKYKSWSPLHLIDYSDVVAFSYHKDNAGYSSGYYITLGDFSQQAIDFAKQNRIVCVGQDDLMKMLVDTKQIRDGSVAR